MDESRSRKLARFDGKSENFSPQESAFFLSKFPCVKVFHKYNTIRHTVLGAQARET